MGMFVTVGGIMPLSISKENITRDGDLLCEKGDLLGQQREPISQRSIQDSKNPLGGEPCSKASMTKVVY